MHQMSEEEAMSLFMEAERIYVQDGPAAVDAWEANLTPGERERLDAEWAEFVAAVKAVADAARGVR
jgi:hypothetical protein